MTPEDPPQTPSPDPAPDQFTLDEWIAATQSCCGIDHPDDTPTTPDQP